MSKSLIEAIADVKSGAGLSVAADEVLEMVGGGFRNDFDRFRKVVDGGQVGGGFTSQVKQVKDLVDKAFVHANQGSRIEAMSALSEAKTLASQLIENAE